MLTTETIRANAGGCACFIETGYGEGLGVQAALDSKCFREIHSIELSAPRVRAGRDRFDCRDGVHIHAGDSRKLLGDIIARARGRCFLWIDAHGGRGPGGAGFETALDDLRQVPAGDHVILIDDLRYFSPALLKDICVQLKTINPAYRIEIVDAGIRSPKHDLRFDIVKASVGRGPGWITRFRDRIKRRTGG